MNFQEKCLSEDAMEWISKLYSMMTVKDYGTWVDKIVCQ
jgi:hypothetical protein